MKVCVIGGGPAGLTTLKTLLGYAKSHAGEFDVILLESSDKLGGTFDQRAYEHGELVSSRQLTAFSDLRIKGPDHVPMEIYVKYLNDYADAFSLHEPVGEAWKGTAVEGGSRIQLGCRVTRMDKIAAGGHRITFERTAKDGTVSTQIIAVDAVSICSGLHVTPAVPIIPGIEALVPQSPPILSADSLPTTPPGFEGPAPANGVRMIHSSQYKHRAEFKDRRVLLLGCGETGMDLAYAAIKGDAKEVVMCHRGGFLSFPKVLNDFKVFGVTFDGDLPIDGLITNLFETAYVHKWISGINLRWFISDFMVKRVLWLLTGTTCGANQWVGGLPDDRLGRAYVFLNKSNKALPYINRPYKPKYRIAESIFGTSYMDPKIDAESEKVIELALFPSHVDKTGRVHFSTADSLSQSAGKVRPEEARMATKEIRPDLVVYCTGYKVDASWLADEYPRYRDQRIDVREICSSEDISLSYIGFVRPGVGAIPPIAEQQAMLWTLLLLKKVPIPTSVPHYRLIVSKTARITHGVDHSAYMSTLAQDIGSSPGLFQLWKEYGVHVLFCYCFGAAFVSFYRLTGPFADSAMAEIVKTELWETICRRGLLGNLFMGAIPMAFYGVLSGLALLIETVWIYLVEPLVSLAGVDVGAKKAMSVGKL